MQRYLAIVIVLFVASPAQARDYDRNDLAERELSVGFGLSPMDVDTRSPVVCANDPSRNCLENVARAEIIVIRGTARRHIRDFYMAAEAELGASLPVAEFPVHPWLAVGGAVGFETADNGWDRLRGYAEIGALGIWANTRLAEQLAFTAEGGVRYVLSSTERPHVLLHLGLRGLYNFSYFGVMSFAGVSWTFD